MKKVIKCGTLFTSTEQGILKDVAVVIEDNMIEAIIPNAEAEGLDAAVIDLSDKFVMPGLIDAHLHVTMDGAPNSTALMHITTDGDYCIEGIINAKRNLMAGFTTIRDECAFNFVDVAIKKAINKGRLEGPRMLVSGMALSATGGHGDDHYRPGMETGTGMAFICNSEDECRKAARMNFKHGADQIKIMGTGGVMSMGDEPGAPEFTYEELKAALDIANSRGRISSVHAHGAVGIKNAIRAGIRSVEHGMLMDDECIDMMVEYGVYLVPTIIAALGIVENGVAAGIHPENVAKAEMCLKNHNDNLKKCRAKGVKICFGTDAGTPFNFHGKQTREFELMVDAGFTPEEVLLAATRTNAEMMKMDSQIGSIEAGKFADIVAFDESPLENIKVMNAVSFIMKDGKVYKA